jgi:hypothetical protein
MAQSPAAACGAIFTAVPLANESGGLKTTSSEPLNPDTISTEFP